MRDLFSNIGAAVAIKPAVNAASVNGEPINLQGAGRVAFVVNTGAIAGAGDFSVKVQESDTDQSADFTDAPAAHVDTNAPATLAADAVYKLGYRGWKQYVRVVLTKAGGTSIAAGAVAVFGDLETRPAA